jgi:hypothetical protein
MMGVEAPETYWTKHKRQVINLWNCCIWLVNLFELYDDARTCQRQKWTANIQIVEQIENKKSDWPKHVASNYDLQDCEAYRGWMVKKNVGG